MSQITEDTALIQGSLGTGDWRYTGEMRSELGLTRPRFVSAMRRLLDAGVVERQGTTNTTSYRLKRQTRQDIAARAAALETRAPTNGFAKMPKLGTIVTGLRWDPERGEYYISFDSGEEVMCQPK